MTDYYDLGTHSRSITTTSPEAQLWFDRGLMWTYSFNLEEAARCFHRVAEHDPECAMAYWGIGMASGAYYNKQWADFTDAEIPAILEATRTAVADALSRMAGGTATEQALIQALDRRYQSDRVAGKDELLTWNDHYAAAMRQVHAAFPDDLDVCALFAEALINRTPWQLWDLRTGQPAAGADTLEAVAVLERALSRMEQSDDSPHPAILHMYIHTMEMSPYPERALRAADALRELVPDSGHLLHMPSHIDVLCGNYHAGMVANSRAIKADRMYMERNGPFNTYTLYRTHDYHFKVYCAMFLGQFRPALAAANELVATIPEELLRQSPPMADWLEGFIATRIHVLVRFGKWREIVAEPLPDDSELYRVTTATVHYAKGLAHAALGQLPEAEAEQRRFADAVDRIPDTRRVFNNTCLDQLAIAAEMLLGEIEYRKGNHDSAFAYLRKAVELYDDLPYDEPWGWMQPVRHALGALLLEQGRLEEAVRVYEADLGLDDTLSRAAQHPDNVWSLHGYTECLRRLGRKAEARFAQARLDVAAARADVTIGASCFCRIGGAEPEASR